MSKVHRYEGREGTVLYDVQRCIRAEECVRGLPVVFDPGRRPWITACRCGASGNKPFCDGSHRQIGFTTEQGEAR